MQAHAVVYFVRACVRVLLRLDACFCPKRSKELCIEIERVVKFVFRLFNPYPLYFQFSFLNISLIYFLGGSGGGEVRFWALLSFKKGKMMN